MKLWQKTDDLWYFLDHSKYRWYVCRKCDVVADRNVLVYQSLDDGNVYAIDVDRNVTHLVVDNRVIVRVY